MSALKDEVTPIRRTTVPEDKRQFFLPTNVGTKHMLAFEFYLYDLAQQQIKDYNGGFWEFYTLDNGAWYMAPEGEGKVQVVAPNMYSGEMSRDAAGLALTLIAINHLLWHTYTTDPERSEKLNAAFYALRDYAAQHPEAAEIYGAID